MYTSTPSNHESVAQYNAIRQAMLDARNKRREGQTPEFQAQVAKAEGNLQLINMVLMSFSAEQNACVDQRVSISHHQHRTEEALRTIMYEMR
ncbi:uncharacterized protein CTRU02_212508 [Colletotrichum truncatum]|uniref:Uncharacterized protein n=2 Tax=Colletotrichum truncatum TaxID=5467 RepID=A0ACC3YEJ1_COLTU|nr:uncharacterized protein CTRU02_13553 [Colletotrichum truncatum]XP_036584603.1 uncharacterized protein CTRU02_05678 [Colletotrichum truncatum]KAF6783317.1 hypothetical protein CTRU02_13553 [Colletotrichum truncatum]KAF6794121.1 hypothetical protein CTRU02_05678 [Colletotrichum truncatum]